jgi:hypothetical protein
VDRGPSPAPGKNPDPVQKITKAKKVWRHVVMYLPSRCNALSLGGGVLCCQGSGKRQQLSFQLKPLAAGTPDSAQKPSGDLC